MKNLILKEKKGSSKTPVPSAKQTRTSREQVSTSRSVSQLQDKIDESSRTPRSNLILTDEQLEFKKIFQEKAYINVIINLNFLLDIIL